MIDNKIKIDINKMSNKKNTYIIKSKGPTLDSFMPFSQSSISRKSIFNFEFKSSKKINQRNINRFSLGFIRKKNSVFQGNNRGSLPLPIIGIQKKRKESLVFAERMLKYKLAKKRLTVQLGDNTLLNNKLKGIDSRINESNDDKDNKKIRKFYLSDKVLNKHSISDFQNSLINKHFKKRKRI